MTILPQLLFVALSVTASTSLAENVVPRSHAGFQVYKISTRDSGIGIQDANFINVAPTNLSTTVRQHRYQIASTGQIGDHSSVNWNQPKDVSYLILPARSDVRYDTGTPGQLDVTSASGLIFRFRSGVLSAITDESGGSPCDVTFNRNAGAGQPDFRIASCENRIVFDSGIGTTNGAYANLKGETRVSDPNGRSCQAVNSTMYERIPGRNTSADVRLKSQDLIYQALKKIPTCASLDLSSIAPGGSSPSRLGPDFLKGLGIN